MSIRSRFCIRRTIYALAVVLFVLGSTVIGRAFTVIRPSFYDPYLFAFIGREWLHGHVPYVDIFENKPPGIFALLALIFRFFPDSFLAIATVEGIFVIGAVGTTYAIMRQLKFSTSAVVIATATAAIVNNLVAFNDRGVYTEIYLLWPACLSMYFFLRAGQKEHQQRWMLLAGVATGVATLFKPTGLASLMAQGLFLLVLVAKQKLSFAAFARTMSVNGFGVLLAWVPALIYFGRYHAIENLIDASFLYNIRYGLGSDVGIFGAIVLTISRLAPAATLVVAAAVVLTWLLSPRRDGAQRAENQTAREDTHFSDASLLFLFWAFFGLLGALAGGRFYHHYFLPVASSLAVLSGFAYTLLIENGAWEGRTNQTAKQALVMFIIGPLMMEQVSDIRQLGREMRFGGPRPPWQDISEALVKESTKGDKLFTWNYIPGVYFTTRLLNSVPLTSAHYLYDFADESGRRRAEFLEMLDKDRPTFVVDDTLRPAVKLKRDPTYKAFREFLEKYYVAVEETPKEEGRRARIYRLNDGAKSMNSRSAVVEPVLDASMATR